MNLIKHNFSAQDEIVLLRPLQKDDIEKLRTWRNDRELTRFLRPIGHITQEMQNQWFEAYLANPGEAVFAIVETNKLNRIAGSVAIYNITEDSAEVGKFLIGDPEARGRGLGSRSIALAVQIGFGCMGLKKLTASVHKENIPSYKTFTKIGFRKTGSHESLVIGVEDEFEIKAEDLLCEDR